MFIDENVVFRHQWFWFWFKVKANNGLPISEAIWKRSRPVNHWLCLTSQQMCHWNRCLHLKVTHTQTKLCSVFVYAYAFWRLSYRILQRMMIASSTLCGCVDWNYKSKLSLRAMIHLAEDLSPLTKATHNIHHPEARSTECLIYGYIYNMTSITNNHP